VALVSVWEEIFAVISSYIKAKSYFGKQTKEKGQSVDWPKLAPLGGCGPPSPLRALYLSYRGHPGSRHGWRDPGRVPTGCCHHPYDAGGTFVTHEVNPVNMSARSEGFEPPPPAHGGAVLCRLSYERLPKVVPLPGFEPGTSPLR
jgi:hypothetical protein